jgi:5-methylcytosine-specific restriction protein A
MAEMPITQGAGNPDWTRDETLLALDLLYRHVSPIHKGHPDIAELSALIYPVEGRRPSCRNEDGVGLKLQNLLSAIDPSRGLSSFATDRALVAEYPRSRAKEVAQIASSIREAIARGETEEPVPDDELFIEGHLLSTQHCKRDSRLRKRLLAQTPDEHLACALCDFSPPQLDRALRESFLKRTTFVP